MDVSRKLAFLPIKAAQDCAFLDPNDPSVMSPMTELAVNFEMRYVCTVI
jgi:hypothetical protein